MSSAAPPNKKRKRNEDAVEEGGLRLTLSKDADQPGTHPLPVLALRTALEIPADTALEAWQSTVDPAEVRLHGESGKIEWDSRAETNGLAGFSYYVAVHRKSQGTVSILPVTPHVMTPTVKSYRDLPERGGADDPASLDYMEQRNMLGNTFGTRKAQKAIASKLRNKLDTTTPDMVKHIESIVKQVTEANVNYPTQEEMQKAHDDSRPIPPFNRDAEDPKDIYDMDAVAPKNELGAMRIFDYINAANEKERAKILPYKKSRFVNERLAAVLKEIEGGSNITGKQKAKVRQLMYLSVLMAFRSRKGDRKDGPRSRLDKLGLQPLIITSVADRFSEKFRNGAQTVSERSGKLLLHYILVLCLAIENYSVDVDTLADDLNISSRQLGVAYKGLGCKLATPTAKEYDQLQALAKAQGVTIGGAKSNRAVLVAPIKFPDPPRKKAKAAKH